jgi:hypothetical protein
MSQSFTSDQVKKLSNSLKVISDLKLAEERVSSIQKCLFLKYKLMRFSKNQRPINLKTLKKLK